MRVLHVLDHSPPVQSGYVYRTLAILREQVALGWQVLPLTTPKQPNARGAKEIVDGWEFVRTPCRAPPSWLPKLASELAILRATTRRLEEVAREWRPRVLHAHSPVLNAIAALNVGHRLGIPVVYEIRALWEDAASSHGTMQPHGLRYALARHLETRAVRRADAVVTISHGLRQELHSRGVRPSDIWIVPNAVDAARFVPHAPPAPGDPRELPGYAPVIGFIGSFYSYEGLDLLVEAARRLIALRPKTRFLLVGGGPEESHIRELCRANDISDHVQVAGWVPHEHVEDWYRQIDILVYPRRRNRLTELVTPLKPLEAMAQGKVILASDVGGHRELIEDGRTGFLFEAENVSDLVQRLIELVDTPAQWPKVGGAARRFIEEERTWQAVAATYVQVYERAFSSSGVQQALSASHGSSRPPDSDF